MITLEQFDKNDFERLINWVDTEEMLVQFGGPLFSFPLTIEQLKAYKNDKNRHLFKVIESGENAIGHAELFQPEDEKTIRICRVLIGDKTKRGQGIGQQIINELLNISFVNLEKENVELNVYDWNTRAIKCYEKVGFAVNPNKTFESEMNGDVWTAINMTIEKDGWKL